MKVAAQSWLTYYLYSGSDSEMIWVLLSSKSMLRFENSELPADEQVKRTRCSADTDKPRDAF